MNVNNKIGGPLKKSVLAACLKEHVTSEIVADS